MSQLEKKRGEKIRQRIKESEKGQENNRKEETRQEEEARKGKEKKTQLSRPYVGTDYIRHWAHIGYQVHQWHWGEYAQGEEVRPALR